MQGYVLIHRSLLDDPMFRNSAERGLFEDMIMLAQWKPAKVRYRDRIISLERGQLAISIRDLVDRSGLSKTTVERLLRTLRNQDTIKTATKTGVTVITLCNYDEYQPSQDGAKTVPRQQPRQCQDTEQRREEINKHSLTSFESDARAKKPGLGDLRPEDFAELAAAEGRDAKRELPNFQDWCRKKGKRFKDYPAAFRNWLRSPYGRSPPTKETPTETTKRLLKGLHERTFGHAEDGSAPDHHQLELHGENVVRLRGPEACG